MLQNYPMCNIHFLQIEICVTFWQFKITKIEMEQNFMYKQKETNEQIKNHIVDAYFSLLKQYGPEDSENISVTEITDWAGVSRTAYYRNFHRKSEIVDFYFRDSLWKTFTERCSEYRFWSYEYGVVFFSLLKEKRDIILLMDEHGYSGIIMDIFNEKNEELAGDMPYNSIERFNLYFAAGGSFNVAMIWLRDGCRETPEQIAQSFVQFTKCCASPFHPSRSYMRDE